MFTIDRIHFGFSDWTIKLSRLSHLVNKQFILIINLYLFSSSLGVNCQNRPSRNFPSSIPSLSPSLSPFSSPSIPSQSPPPPPSSSSSTIQQTKCPYTSEQILGVIFTSVIVTIVVIGLTLILFWYLWKKKLITFSSGSSHWIRDVDLNDKTIQADTSKQQQHHPNGNLLSDEDKKYKRLIKSLPPLTSVFNHLSNQSKGPIKSLDDTFISTKPEQVSVQMTGHDFTGLGFNICGNMRDGIFIKDVLTRGPANESGLIKAGDRIMSITVSCEKMVYEDALTILSYASPYDVTLQIEKTSKSRVTTPKGGTGNGHLFMPRRYANGFSGSSDSSHHRILHPVFRSHSVGELTTRLNSCNTSGVGVGEDDKPMEEKSFGSIKSINSLLRKIKTSLYRSTASIKSHQSDKGKMTTDYCSANTLNDSVDGYHHSCYSLDAGALMNGQISSSSSYILPSPPTNNNLTTNEIVINMNPKEPMVTSIKHFSASVPDDKMINVLPEETIEPKMEKPVIDKSMVMITSGSPVEIGMNKKLNQGKRRAPSPPSPASSTCSIEMKPELVNERDVIEDGTIVLVKNPRNEQRSTTPGGSKVETHADIHREQGSSEDDFTTLQGQSLSDISEIKSPAIDISLSLAMESLTSDDPTTEPLAVNLVKEMKGDRAGRSPSPASGKSKSCSMSDLTMVKNKKPTTTIILERAVSLDLRDQLGPEENKILQQGTMIEDNQGLLRWSESKPPVCGPDSLSTTYSSEMLGSNSKTNDFIDESLTITIDESFEKPIAPKPTERTSLKRNSSSNSSESRLRSSSKFEAIDMTINEEDATCIVAPPDGFGSDHQLAEISVPSKPSVENVKLKSNPDTDSRRKFESSQNDDRGSLMTKVQSTPITIEEPSKNVQQEKITGNNPKTKPSLPEKPTTLSSKFESLSSSQERFDSTSFDVPLKTGSYSPLKDEIRKLSNTHGKEREKEKEKEKDDNFHRKINSPSSSTSSSSSMDIVRYTDESETLEKSPVISREEFLARKSVFAGGKLPKPSNNSNLIFINKPSSNGFSELHKNEVSHNIEPKVTPSTIIQIGESGDNEFESWNYLSDTGSNLPSLTDETLYKTSCDMGQLNDGPVGEMMVKKI